MPRSCYRAPARSRRRRSTRSTVAITTPRSPCGARSSATRSSRATEADPSGHHLVEVDARGRDDGDGLAIQHLLHRHLVPGDLVRTVDSLAAEIAIEITGERERGIIVNLVAQTYHAIHVREECFSERRAVAGIQHDYFDRRPRVLDGCGEHLRRDDHVAMLI